MRKYLRAANVGWSGLLLDDVKQMNFTDDEMKIFRLEPGDLLLNEASGSPKEVGKPALWGGEIEDCAFQNTLLRVRPSSEADPRYLLHYFGYEAATGAFARGSRGVGIHHLGREALSKWPVPLPPLDEQRRIAAILDQADGLRAKRRCCLNQYSDLATSVFHSMFGRRGTALIGGRQSTIGDTLRFKSGSFLPSSKQVPGIHPVYGGNGVTGCHHEYMFDKPMVVVGRVGAYCGVTHLTAPNSWITDNALYVSETPAGLQNSYLVAALRAANLNQYASQSGQPLISAKRLAHAPLFIPSKETQSEFHLRTSTIRAEHRRGKSSLRQLDSLFTSLQSRAFRGEL